MMPASTIPKSELKVIMKRFLKDQTRGISTQLFADLAGISKVHLQDVFLYCTEPLTERIQYRVSKAYNEWKNGEVAIMQNQDRTRFVEYRREAKPIMSRTTGLQVVNGEIKIKVGISNKYDYSVIPLDEQLRKG